MLTKSYLVLLVGSDVEVKKSTKVLGLTPLENSWMQTTINQHNTLQQCYHHALRQQDLHHEFLYKEDLVRPKG